MTPPRRMMRPTFTIFGSMIEDGINGRTVVLRRLESIVRGHSLRLLFVQLVVIVFVVVGDLGRSPRRRSGIGPQKRLCHSGAELGRILLLVVRATFAIASTGFGIRSRRIIVIFVWRSSLGDCRHKSSAAGQGRTEQGPRRNSAAVPFRDEDVFLFLRNLALAAAAASLSLSSSSTLLSTYAPSARGQAGLERSCNTHHSTRGASSCLA